MAWIYDRATGRFLARVSGSARHAAANETDTRGVYNGEVADPAGMIMQDGAPVARPEAAAERLADARASALRQMRATIDRAAEQITGAYPRAERDSWPQKEVASRAVLAGEAGDADFEILQPEAAQTGQTVEALASQIAANAVAFRAGIGALTGLRRVAEAAIEAAEDEAGVTAALAALRDGLATMEGGQ